MNIETRIIAEGKWKNGKTKAIWLYVAKADVEELKNLQLAERDYEYNIVSPEITVIKSHDWMTLGKATDIWSKCKDKDIYNVAQLYIEILKDVDAQIRANELYFSLGNFVQF